MVDPRGTFGRYLFDTRNLGHVQASPDLWSFLGHLDMTSERKTEIKAMERNNEKEHDCTRGNLNIFYLDERRLGVGSYTCQTLRRL